MESRERRLRSPLLLKTTLLNDRRDAGHDRAGRQAQYSRLAGEEQRREIKNLEVRIRSEEFDLPSDDL